MSSSLPHAGTTNDTRGKCDHDHDDDDRPQQQQQQPPQLQSSPPTHTGTTTTTQRAHAPSQPLQHRKLRVLVITMGGQRQEQIRNLFRDLSNDFEEPVFSEGVPSRSLRNRMKFLEICHQAGLLPELEWQAMQQAAAAASQQESDAKNFFSCLDNIPIDSSHRRRVGIAADCKVHYSIELWRKAKTINRGRSVLACLLAHLIAMQKFTTSDYLFDVLLEDNVRVPVSSQGESICATWIREAIQASLEYERETGTTCHLRYYGWLGSLENLQWIHECHLPKRAFQSSCNDASKDDDKAAVVASATLPIKTTVAPFPTTQDIDSDLLEMKNKQELELLTTALHTQSSLLEQEEENHDNDGNQQETVPETNKKQQRQQPRPPGGTPVWGAYAYWISKQGYEHVLSELQQDVGSLLWKGKRARYYSVKPIDKILPRKIMAHFGTAASNVVHISSRPTFFRAPMLTSKIHAKWDAGFCQSTQYQLDKFCNGMTWSDLWLTSLEKLIVRYHQEHGKWLTLGELEAMQQQQQQQTATTATVVGATNSNAIWKQDA